jgi:hypothetical protein
MDVLTIYAGSDMLLEVEHLSDDADGSSLDAATVRVTLRDAANNPVGGETWPLAMGYVTDSKGCYRATLADTLGVVAGQRYKAIITADAGPGRKAEWTVDVICKPRRR